MARRRSIGAAVLVGLLGCAPEPLDVRVDPGDVAFDVAFLVEVEGDEVTAVGAPFGRGPPRFGEPRFTASDDARDLLLVTLSADAIRAAVPDFDRERLEDLALVAVPPDASAVPARIRLSGIARLYRVEVGAARLDAEPRWGPVAELTLSVPRDLFRCERPLGRVEAFGARPRLLEPPPPGWSGGRSVVDLVEVAPGRVVAVTPRAVFSLRRGQAIAPPSGAGPARTLPLPAGLPGELTFVALAGPTAAGDVLAIATSTAAGLVARLRVGADDLAWVETATATLDGPLPPLRSALLDGGRLLVGAARGRLYASSADRLALARTPVSPPGMGVARDITALAPTATPGITLVGLHGELAGVGDVARGGLDWRTIRPPDAIPLSEEPGLLDVSEGPDGERWAVGRSSLVRRQAPGAAWTVPSFPPAPRLDGCTFGEPVLRIAAARFPAVVVDADYVFTAAARCPALLALDRRDGCLAVLGLPDEEVRFGAGDPIEVIRRGPGGLYLGGEEGRLHVLPR